MQCNFLGPHSIRLQNPSALSVSGTLATDLATLSDSNRLAMATKYPKSAQTGESGVAFVRKAVTDAAGIFRAFETADIGIDAAIEFLTPEREPSGDVVLVQIKAGQSNIKNGRFYIGADRDHFETWARYAIPVAGIVLDPSSSQARWVDISAHLRENPDAIQSGPFVIEAPSTNVFSTDGFEEFAKHFRRQIVAATQVHITPNLLIRAWESTDAKPTRALLSTIAPDYPVFDKWLEKKFGDASASKKVVVVDGVVAAFSMWQAKDRRNVKLQTFIVGPSFRGTAIGQHLLYHEIRTWAAQPDIQRVHVTVASSRVDLIGYFRSFGFRVEGFSARRYPRRAAELVMAKQFLRLVVRTPHELGMLVDQLQSEIWGLDTDGASRFGVRPDDLAVPMSVPAVTMTLNSRQARFRLDYS
jgi:ribosomal protein S18 acetylase RimI-like enzyme